MNEPKGPAERPSNSASASVRTRSFRPGGVIPVVVIAGLLVVGLTTRHGSSHPAAEPSGLSTGETDGSPSVTRSSAQPPHSFDARGVFFPYPASWHPAALSLGSQLVPSGSSWSVAFTDGGGGVIAVAAYPAGDPGTAAGRSKMAVSIARTMAGPSASPSSKATHTSGVYPSFRYPVGPSSDVSEGSPPGVGFVVFTHQMRYAIGCRSAVSTADAGTRCDYLLESFRDTRSGLSSSTPTIRSVADAVYEAWRSGTPSAAGVVATPGVLRYLVQSPWAPGTARPSCDAIPGRADQFSCMVMGQGAAGTLLVVEPVDGRFKVAAIGPCSGDLTHGTCYVLRTRGDSFP